ncbi:MAG: type II secretion system protein [Candidatus Levybacteria bacterium]|nr:type II secretion system protein [Candidatus Levybacteria bacterium]
MKFLKNRKGFTTFSSHERGFTLIELLVVIGILAVLLAVTYIAINPARQSAQANDAKRRNDVNEILNAVNKYMVDNNGDVPLGITTTSQNIKTGGADICSALVSLYIASLPSDPKENSGSAIKDCAVAGGYDTGYMIVQSATNNRITVNAPNAEIAGTVISVTR